MVKDQQIITPPLGTILAGITRDTVMQLAQYLGFTVIERAIAQEEVFSADEAFFTGTAAEVSPIRTLDDRIIGNGEIGPITKQIKDGYHAMVTAQHSAFNHMITFAR